MSTFVFSDASRTDINGQIGVMAELSLRKLQKELFFMHSLGCNRSQKACKRVQTAEILAAAEGIDEDKALYAVYSELLGTKVHSNVLIYSKALFSSLYT